MVKKVAVAAAVIERPDGSFLLGQRAAETFYPGYWEFPGGKVEAGETPREALVRELGEELGIAVHTAYPWIMREHHYEHAHVKLHFFRVPGWSGEVQHLVHSALSWQYADRLDVAPMLPANGPILKALRLPRAMGITHAAAIGVEAQLAALDVALANGLRLVQVREATLDAATRERFAAEVRVSCRAHDALMLVNGDAALAERVGADGVHLPASALTRLHTRPALEWVGASCHSRAELEHAAALGVDYALLGPVQATASHPDAAGIGWARFAELVRELPMPVLAIGGLTARDMEAARSAGAHGIAAIRGAWA